VQLQQLILNLILNGIVAMVPVTDRTERLLICSKQQSAGTVLVEITDTSAGLQDPKKVFESFYTTRPNGLGMGLAIYRSIVESHNGSLWVESREPGRNILFYPSGLAEDRSLSLSYWPDAFGILQTA